MRPEVWLVRHGETEWSLSGQHSGRNDLPLTARGEEEARAVAPLLADTQFDRVYCSTLQRARKTCELAGFSLRAEFRPELQEWDYGDLTGHTREEICLTYPDWNVWDGPVPGGESAAEIGSRAQSTVERIRPLGGRTLIFAHGHFLRVLTAKWLGLPPEAGRHFSLYTSAVSVLGEESGSPSIVTWNWLGSGPGRPETGT